MMIYILQKKKETLETLENSKSKRNEFKTKLKNEKKKKLKTIINNKSKSKKERRLLLFVICVS